MGFRFRKSIKVIPGVRLNISNRGVSTSLGGRGATVNIGRKGTQATIGIPGTGLSYSAKLGGRRERPASTTSSTAGATIVGWIVIGSVLLMIGSCLA